MNEINFILKMAVHNAEDPLSGAVPEVPTFITLISDMFENSNLAKFLIQWESLIFSIMTATIVAIIFHIGARKREMIPTGLQNFLELIVDSINRLIIGVLGHEGRKYVPFLGTLFLYILSMNLIGLVPFMKSPSSNLNVTVGLALCVFLLVQYLNILNFGLGGFIYHLAGSPKGILGWCLVPLMLPLEVITQFSRPLTLSLRLFGNVLGGDIFIGIFILFGISLLSTFNIPVGVPLQVPFMFLGLLTGVMQALVFTLLSSIYILLAMSDHEDTLEREKE